MEIWVQLMKIEIVQLPLVMDQLKKQPSKNQLIQNGSDRTGGLHTFHMKSGLVDVHLPNWSEWEQCTESKKNLYNFIQILDSISSSNDYMLPTETR